ncbi:MAG TPA: chromosomal replication initiator protein DnaA [Caulobacteraceae bacterium]
MNTTSYAQSPRIRPAAEVWTGVCTALRRELGDSTFDSWLGQATLHETADACVLATRTAFARDWVKRHAWRRLVQLWDESDSAGRALDLKALSEIEALLVAEAASNDLEPRTDARVIEIAPAPAPAVTRPAGLQERFTFETFVAGGSNDFAYQVARRIAAWDDGHFNPVVFHGPYGFGKTHLLNAIAAEAWERRPDKTVIYLTAERFLSTFLKAVSDRSTAAFKESLRAADLLLIDDVHFVGGKTATQEELFHTLASLMGEGRRVVLSADRPPQAITEIDARLRSLLTAGLVCGIETADRDLRMGILQRKLVQLCRQQKLRPMTARPEVLTFLADRFTASVRELEGALNTLLARTGEGLAALTVDEAQTLLRPHLKVSDRRITVDDIQKATAEHYGMKQSDLLSERRTRAVARPRQAAMWLCKQLTTRSLPDIGRRFGGRDHTTVLHAVRRIEELKQTDAQLTGDLEALTRKLRG